MVYCVPVFPLLFITEVFAPVWGDWYHIGGAVREINTGTAKGDLCYMVCKIAYRMRHGLIAGCDACRCSIIIGAEVGRDTATLTCFDDAQQRVAALVVHDDLGSFDHRFHF